jgi:hypothetical protein
MPLGNMRANGVRSAAQAARAPTTTQAEAGQSFHYSLISVPPQQETLPELEALGPETVRAKLIQAGAGSGERWEAYRRIKSHNLLRRGRTSATKARSGKGRQSKRRLTMSKELLAGVAVLALAMGSAAQAARAPTTTQAEAGHSFHYSLISVPPQQETLLSQAASRMPEQNLPRGLPGNPVIGGDMLPNSVKLTAIPNGVKQKIRQETAGNKLEQARMGNLLSDDLVRARNSDVLVVDPVDRVVESVIRGKEKS